MIFVVRWREREKSNVFKFSTTQIVSSWSENGKMFSGDELKDHLVNEIIPKQNDEAPPTDGIRSATIRTFQIKLGTTACDAKEVKEKINHNLIEEAREELKGRDIESLLQSYRAPKIDSEFIGERIEMRFNVREPEEDTTKDVWFKGVVLGIKRNNKVLIRWDNEGETDSEHTLLITKFNSQVEEGWRMDVERKII